MKGRRHVQVGDEIREVLARALREELHDPRIGFVTITDVDVAPDLRHARVFVSTFDRDPAPILEALDEARGVLQRAIARDARLRFTPRLRFEVDDSTATGFRVESLIDDALEPDQGPTARADERDPARDGGGEG